MDNTSKLNKESIIQECKDQDLTPEQTAYVLATAEWETNFTFKPVKEAYWLSEDWREHNLSYYPYYGRGYVQITHKENYKKFSDLLGVDLVKHPDKALEPEIAKFILVYGSKHGIFTGKKLSDYINNKTDFINARRVINGTDKADKISIIANEMLSNLA